MPRGVRVRVSPSPPNSNAGLRREVIRLLYTESDVGSSPTPGTKFYTLVRIVRLFRLVWDQKTASSNLARETIVLFRSTRAVAGDGLLIR